MQSLISASYIMQMKWRFPMLTLLAKLWNVDPLTYSTLYGNLHFMLKQKCHKFSTEKYFHSKHLLGTLYVQIIIKKNRNVILWNQKMDNGGLYIFS